MSDLKESNGGITAKIAALGYLQNIIDRMANNSLKVKTLYIVFISFFLTLKNSADIKIHLDDFIPIMACFFAVISDGYYLSLERAFRTIYDEKAQTEPSFSVNYFDVKTLLKEHKKNIFCTVFSSYMILFYIFSIFFIYFILWGV